jgi:hypothetical protein
VRLGVFRIVMLLTALYAVQQNKMGVFEHADGIASELTSRVWNPIYAFQVLGIEPLGPDFGARRVGGAVDRAVDGDPRPVDAALVRARGCADVPLDRDELLVRKAAPRLRGARVRAVRAAAGAGGARLSIDALLARIRRTRRGRAIRPRRPRPRRGPRCRGV